LATAGTVAVRKGNAAHFRGAAFSVGGGDAMTSQDDVAMRAYRMKMRLIQDGDGFQRRDSLSGDTLRFADRPPASPGAINDLLNQIDRVKGTAH